MPRLDFFAPTRVARENLQNWMVGDGMAAKFAESIRLQRAAAVANVTQGSGGQR